MGYRCTSERALIISGFTAAGIEKCRQRKNEIAESFLARVGSELAAVVMLRDVVPLLLPVGKDAALVSLSIAKANSQVCSCNLLARTIVQRGQIYEVSFFGGRFLDLHVS